MNLTNMKRWIVASALKTFRNFSGGEQLYPEGADKKINIDSYFEIRCDGPYSTPLASGCYRFYIEINILANCKRNERNFFKKENMQGIAQEMLNRDFCVYKIGNVGKTADDDESYLGVMQLIPSNQIKTSDFGQVDDHVEVYESTTEAHYEMYIP